MVGFISKNGSRSNTLYFDTNRVIPLNIIDIDAFQYIVKKANPTLGTRMGQSSIWSEESTLEPRNSVFR